MEKKNCDDLQKMLILCLLNYMKLWATTDCGRDAETYDK